MQSQDVAGASADLCLAPRRRNAWTAAVALATAWLGLCAPAHAALGASASSVEADRAHLSATVVSTTYATYTAYTLTLANRGVVQEFSNGQGEVFAVAWHGPGRPDLRQLLGARFDTLQAENTPAPTRPRRRRTPLAVNRADFIVHSAGHSGAFRGVAYLPQAIPAGFSANDIQ